MAELLPSKHLKVLEKLVAAEDGQSDEARDLDSEMFGAIEHPEQWDEEQTAQARRRYYAICALEMDVNNGGFHQFFLNHGPTCALEAAAFLHGAVFAKAREVVNAALAALPPRVATASFQACRDYLADEHQALESRLHEIDDLYFELDTSFYALAMLARFRLALTHKQEFFRE